TDQLRVTRIVKAGSGFISQHAKELLFGLGRSKEIRKATIVWPSGLTQSLSDLSPGRRVWIEEGRGVVRSEPFEKPSLPSRVPPPAVVTAEAAAAGTWLYQPFPAPDFALKDLEGQDRSLSSLAGRPA